LKSELKTRTLSASDARQQWSQLLNSVFRGESRVVVEKSGIPVAAIVSMADLERLSRLDKQRGEGLKALVFSWEAFKDVALEEVEDEVDKAVEAARRQVRKRKRSPASA